MQYQKYLVIPTQTINIFSYCVNKRGITNSIIAADSLYFVPT